MQINKIQANNLQASTSPNFKALYFATPKIQQKCLKHPRFSNFLNSSVIKETVDKHNIVITKFFTHLFRGKSFEFRACTDILVENNKIIPAGMKSPTIKFDNSYKVNGFLNEKDDMAFIGLSRVGVKDATTNFLSHSDLFEKLYFETDKEKEGFQSNIYSHVFFDIKGVKDAIKRYNVIIHSGDPLKFSVATDIVQKNNKILPAGLVTRTFKIDSSNYKDDMHSNLGGYLDTVIKMTNQPVPTADDNDDSF